MDPRQHLPHEPTDGLLDGEESQSRIVLGHNDDADGVYPPGTFGTVVSGMITVLVVMGLSYLLPLLAEEGVIENNAVVDLARESRPWTEKDPVPFWNLVGRELLGEGDQAQAEAAAVDEFTALALAEAARDTYAEP